MLTNVENIRQQFPILSEKLNKADLVYLDNAATTQKPKVVIDALTDYYSRHNANIHRGVHGLSRRATDMFEAARQTAADFFSVANPQQIIFTAGTTDGINMVAQGLAKNHLKAGDEIILSVLEHHSNTLPWQMWAQENGGTLKIIPLHDDHSLNVTSLASLISNKTKLIAIGHVSNTLGVINDLQSVKSLATQHGIPWLIDGAQSAPHMSLNLTELNPDFFVCSAHKMYGPTGTGILYLNQHWLNNLPISKTGGGTIKTVSFDKTTYAEGALRFEPGTPNIADVIAFAEALKFMKAIGMSNIFAHEQALANHTENLLSQMPQVELYGCSKHKAGVVSFNVKGQHPFDVGTLLDKYGIAVRTGHHCTQPLMQHLGIQGTVRASFAVYNTMQEVDYFAEKLHKVIRMLS